MEIVKTGEIIEYGMSDQNTACGPKLFRKNVYEDGYSEAEPVLPPFDKGSANL